jgi:hypothetical protein
VKQPITLITEVEDGTIYFETGMFERENPGEKLPQHVGNVLKALTKDWKHKSELYPPGNPDLATKYLHRLHRRIPGVFQGDQQGNYRLNPQFTIAQVK